MGPGSDPRSWGNGLFSLHDWKRGTVNWFLLFFRILFRVRNNSSVKAFMKWLSLCSHSCGLWFSIALTYREKMNLREIPSCTQPRKDRPCKVDASARSVKVKIGGKNQAPPPSLFLTGVAAMQWAKSIHLDRRWSPTRTNSWFEMILNTTSGLAFLVARTTMLDQTGQVVDTGNKWC
jgi:hypothetical protein